MSISPKKIILIGNPIAGGGAFKKIKTAYSILERKGFDVQLMLTSQKGDAESFAKQISIEPQKKPSSLDRPQLTTHSSLIVIAAGGDGTYNEVANGLAYSDIPMAILPLGTTSVLAKELNIPDELENALNIAINGEIEIIHLGKITCRDIKNLKNTNQDSEAYHSSFITRHFLLMAGVGFDGEIVCGINEKVKRYAGKGAYIFSGIKTLLKYKPSEIIIKSQNSKLIGYNAIIGKASCYGGDFKITPDARLTEPHFYVFVMHKKGRLNLIHYISRIINRSHLKLKDMSYFKASEIEIEGNAHIQIDGDYLGVTPAKIEIAASALRLVKG